MCEGDFAESARQGKRQRRVDATEKHESEWGPIGVGKSTINRNKLLEEMRNGTLNIRDKQQKNYEEKVRGMDRHAEFRYGQDGWFVFHSPCGKWEKMKEPYNTDRVTSHLARCKVLEARRRDVLKGSAVKGADSEEIHMPAPARSLHHWLSTTTPLQQSIPLVIPPQSIFEESPCTGLTDAIDPRISVYLGRTGARGGGSRSETVIAQELYGSKTKFGKLTESKKEKVRLIQQHDNRWRNEHDLRKVFSVVCQKRVATFTGKTSRLPTDRELALQTTCSECKSVYALKSFKTAINKSKKTSKPENQKFLNKRFQNEALSKLFLRCQGLQVLADEVSEIKSTYSITVFTFNSWQGSDYMYSCARLATEIMAGNGKKNHGLLRDFFSLALEMEDRDARGVGKQNISYGPVVTELANLMHIMCPQVLKPIRPYIQLPTNRHLL